MAWPSTSVGKFIGLKIPPVLEGTIEVGAPTVAPVTDVLPNPAVRAPVIAVAISVAEGIARATAVAISSADCLGVGALGNAEIPILVQSRKLLRSARESKCR
jgi:hypothetical protein